MMPNFEITTEYLDVSLLAFTPGIVGVSMILYIWLKIPRTRTTLVFFTFVISCSVWQIAEGFMRLSVNAETALFWNRCITLSVMPIVVAGLHFALLFAQQKKILQSNLFFILVYFPAIFFIAAQMLNIYSWKLVHDETWHWISDPDLDPFQTAEIFWTFCMTSATMYFLAKYAFDSRKKEVELQRRSIMLCIGYSIPTLVGIICQIIFPQVFGLKELPLTSAAIIFFSIASFIALKKYNLFRYSSSFPANRILKIMNEGVLIVDNELNIRYSNSGFSRITGHTREGLLGKSINCLGPSYLDRKKWIFTSDKSAALPERIERSILAQDGTERIVFYNYSPYIDKSGNVTGTIFLFTDITEIAQANEKVKREKKQALQFQSQLLSAQLSPHFIYNSLNSIQYYILEANEEPALDYISRFSMLTRNVLNNSLKDHITLFDEISFLESYLSLEQKRRRNQFTYEIKVCSQIDPEDIMIPPMLLQPYVENSIIHGLSLITKGVLTISFVSEQGRILCEIADNGIGRSRSIGQKECGKGSINKSHGMRITKTRLDLLNEINKPEYFVQIEDLEDSNSVGIGTKVLVYFPKVYF